MDKEQENPKQEAYQEKAEARLRELEARVDLWRAKAGQATAEAKLQFQELLETVGSRQKTVQGRLQELREVGAEVWEEARANVEDALGELQQAVDDAAAVFD